MNDKTRSERRPRPLIAFFDYGDVFEDFYPHYGVTQEEFATRWADTGNHALLSIIQECIGDVVWYQLSLKPHLREAIHQRVGCRVEFVRSSPVHRTLWRAFYNTRWSWRWTHRYPAYALAASYSALLSAELLRTLRRDRPDCLLLQDYATGRYDVLLAAARMLRVPIIAQHTGSTRSGFVGMRLRKRTLREADMLLASSSHEMQWLVSEFGVNERRVTTLLTPIDTDAYRPLDRNQACRDVALDPTRRHILFLGRLDDETKRVSVLIEAFAALSARHPEADLVVAGDGPDAGMLRNLAEAASANVHFPGWVRDVRTKASYYNAAEVLVLPSRREGFPTVVGEAMACGTAVVASDLAGTAELVESGHNGWLVPPDKPEVLTEVLDGALSDPGLLRRVSEAARRTAAVRVSRNAIGEQLREIFQQVGVR